MASVLVPRTACRRSGLRCAGVVDSEKTLENEWVALVLRYVPFLHYLFTFLFCVFDLCIDVLHLIVLLPSMFFFPCPYKANANDHTTHRYSLEHLDGYRDGVILAPLLVEGTGPSRFAGKVSKTSVTTILNLPA